MSYNASGGWGASGGGFNQLQQPAQGEDDGGWGGPPEKVEWAPPGAWPSDPAPKSAPSPIADISKPAPATKPTSAPVQDESVRADTSKTRDPEDGGWGGPAEVVNPASVPIPPSTAATSTASAASVSVPPSDIDADAGEIQDDNAGGRGDEPVKPSADNGGDWASPIIGNDTSNGWDGPQRVQTGVNDDRKKQPEPEPQQDNSGGWGAEPATLKTGNNDDDAGGWGSEEPQQANGGWDAPAPAPSSNDNAGGWGAPQPPVRAPRSQTSNSGGWDSQSQSGDNGNAGGWDNTDTQSVHSQRSQPPAVRPARQPAPPSQSQSINYGYGGGRDASDVGVYIPDAVVSRGPWDKPFVRPQSDNGWAGFAARRRGGAVGGAVRGEYGGTRERQPQPQSQQQQQGGWNAEPAQTSGGWDAEPAQTSGGWGNEPAQQSSGGWEAEPAQTFSNDADDGGWGADPAPI
ncbi:hypothetical protein I306_03264, partial [Cryptococcus gattii EJB2]